MCREKIHNGYRHCFAYGGRRLPFSTKNGKKFRKQNTKSHYYIILCWRKEKKIWNQETRFQKIPIPNELQQMRVMCVCVCAISSYIFLCVSFSFMRIYNSELLSFWQIFFFLSAAVVSLLLCVHDLRFEIIANRRHAYSPARTTETLLLKMCVSATVKTVQLL